MATVSFHTEEQTLYAHLAGEIDHDSAQRLRAQIDSAITARLPARLVLDLSAVGFMDSSGIGLILGRQRRMMALGGTVQVRCPPQPIQKLLALAHIPCQEVTQ